MPEPARKPPVKADERAEVLSMRVRRTLRLKFQQQMAEEGREHLTPFILDCAIDGLESRITRASLEAYRRSTRNTAGGGS